jgi:3-oxoisoapionate kinase
MTTTDARPLLGFYGDDFTGSTDALESLALGGVPSVLFLEPPGPEALRGRFAGVRAFGVAGVGRSLSPEQMDQTLPAVFEAMKRLMGSGVFHYKVCSTFDSSPEVGSIGRAIEIGQRVFGSRFVSLVVGAPALGRYCLFGNLFAAAGGDVYRIDRHPTMSRHPVTPMDEADLRLHLGRQTSKAIALMDLLALSGTPEEVDRRFFSLWGGGAEVILFDVLDEPRLAEVGRLVWSCISRGPRPLFAVGSSGLGHALTAHWRAAGLVSGPASFPSPGAADRLIVISGSCSPATRGQVERALASGFIGIDVDASRLVDPEAAEAERAAVVRRALGALADAPGVVLASATGPDDPRIAATLRRGSDRGAASHATRRRLGEQLGAILRDLLDASRVRRVVVAGGDTSGQVVRQLGLDALEIVAPMAPGAPLCRAASRRPALDGLELVLKGGQVGPVDVFERILEGTP